MKFTAESVITSEDSRIEKDESASKFLKVVEAHAIHRPEVYTLAQLRKFHDEMKN